MQRYELLIRTIDKLPLVVPAYVRASQRGDIIAIVPDGWEWSERERSNPEWLIIKADNLTEQDVESLLEPGRSEPPENARSMPPSWVMTTEAAEREAVKVGESSWVMVPTSEATVSQSQMNEGTAQLEFVPAPVEGYEPAWRRRIGINIDGLTVGQVFTRDELYARAF
ncbi:hypothetical protein [Massilia soli]|uniref:Uncharacterized protein n=1 Tax=Massilia soli TaxID=2792854 RepID=A0ABS7SRB5_9BURK|nr:hypothetical protein [Massilia soli]MBZ2208480.1 hypothetical protein [Massilia soli]